MRPPAGNGKRARGGGRHAKSLTMPSLRAASARCLLLALCLLASGAAAAACGANCAVCSTATPPECTQCAAGYLFTVDAQGNVVPPTFHMQIGGVGAPGAAVRPPWLYAEPVEGVVIETPEKPANSTAVDPVSHDGVSHVWHTNMPAGMSPRCSIHDAR